MISLIRDMFLTPEAQADAYDWAAVLLAHCAIGALIALTLCLMTRPARAAVVTSACYLIFWEGGQLIFAGGSIGDGMVDAAAVAIGGVTAASAWAHCRGGLISAAVALSIILNAGIARRRK